MHSIIRPNALIPHFFRRPNIHNLSDLPIAALRQQRLIHSPSILAEDHNFSNYLPITALRHQRLMHSPANEDHNSVRISTLLQKHLGLSRRQSERMILTERITLYGKVVTSPTFEFLPSEKSGQVAIKVDGKLVHDIGKTLELLRKEQRRHAENITDEVDAQSQTKQSTSIQKQPCFNPNTRVWLCNKLKRELITEDDPDGRPSMLQRLIRGGVGETNKKKTNQLPLHLKPVGRLDMMTEGLMIVTNDGQYARALELPVNQLWRTYRVRVHGRLTLGKLNAMRKGCTVKIDDNVKDKTASGEVVKTTGKTVKYKGIKVSIERKSLSNRQKRGGLGQAYTSGTNTWLQITCTEGKNRMLRRILSSMGLDVTRLIRISYGDYELNTIPPGRAVEVHAKSLDSMKRKGPLFASERKESGTSQMGSRKRSVIGDGSRSDEPVNAVEWINYT